MKTDIQTNKCLVGFMIGAGLPCFDLHCNIKSSWKFMSRCTILGNHKIHIDELVNHLKINVVSLLVSKCKAY